MHWTKSLWCSQCYLLCFCNVQTLTAAAAAQQADAVAAAAASFSNDDAVVVIDAAAFESSSNDTAAVAEAAAEECDKSISAPTTDQHQGMQCYALLFIHCF
jgi:hypothetical protein